MKFRNYFRPSQITIDGLARILCMNEYLDRDMQTRGVADETTRYFQNDLPSPNSTCLHQIQPSFHRILNHVTKMRFGSEPEIPHMSNVADHRHPTAVKDQWMDGASNKTNLFLRELPTENHNFKEQEKCSDLESILTSPGNNIDKRNTASSGDSVDASADPAETEICRKQLMSSDKSLENDIREIKWILRAYICRLSDKDRQARVTKEWRIVAGVLDRLFFYIYVSIILISLATIFPKG